MAGEQEEASLSSTAMLLVSHDLLPSVQPIIAHGAKGRERPTCIAFLGGRSACFGRVSMPPQLDLWRKWRNQVASTETIKGCGSGWAEAAKQRMASSLSGKRWTRDDAGVVAKWQRGGSGSGGRGVMYSRHARELPLFCQKSQWLRRQQGANRKGAGGHR